MSSLSKELSARATKRVSPARALTLLLCLCAAACESKSSQPASAGGEPFTAYAIGPPPGPNKDLYRPANPYATDKSVLADGRHFFVWYNCSGCHGDHGGGGMGPSLRDTTWRYGSDAAAIFASIAEGRQYGMPAWGTRLPREQIWKIVSYIQSLRTPDEPDPSR